MPTQHQVSQKEDKGKGASEYKYLVTSNRSSLLGVSERRQEESSFEGEVRRVPAHDR